MKHLTQIWFLAGKDLKRFVSDRWALLFFIVFPFLFITMFSLMLGSIGSQDERLELHLVTREAAGSLSSRIISAMETRDETALGPGEPKIVWDKSYDEAKQAVEAKALGGFLAFPSDFTEAITTGHSTTLEIIADAEAINTRAALHGLAGSIVNQIGSQQVIVNASVSLLIEEGLINAGDAATTSRTIQQSLMSQGNAAPEGSVITFGVEKVGEVEAENPANWVIPGYLVMFVFFAAALSAETIVRERQNHTLERLLSTSVKREAILGGMFAGTAAKGLIQIAIFWIVGILVFKIDLGIAPAAVILLSITLVIMSSAFTLMLATIARTERSAGSIGVLTSLILAPLGGCWWPLFVTPKWMQSIAKITPHAWANTGFNKLMVFGADFNSAVPEMLVLIGFAVAFSMIAIARFRTSAV